MEYLFDWDEAKAESNLQKHGVSFLEARSVFSDPLRVTYSDDEHSEEEERFLTVGQSVRLRLLIVSHTEQETVDEMVLIRIISCRKVTRQEREDYEG